MHGDILGELPKPAEVDRVARLEERVTRLEDTMVENAALVQRMKEMIVAIMPKPS